MTLNYIKIVTNKNSILIQIFLTLGFYKLES